MPGPRGPTSISANRCWPTSAALPAAVADLLRAFPFDFLYGNIAADSSIAKKYAPVGRHCHSWHVGQEIHDLARSDALRAFGLGYLSHLAADVVAHNYFVPRQLVLTSSTTGFGHSYWESRFETPFGDQFARTAKEVILLDHASADAHLDRIIAPTIFSVKTNRRLFRGMVHLTESQGWQRAFQVAEKRSRWDLPVDDVERHMGLSFDFIMDMLADPDRGAARTGPIGRSSAAHCQAHAAGSPAGRWLARSGTAQGGGRGALRVAGAEAPLLARSGPEEAVGGLDPLFVELQTAVAGRYSLERELGRGGMGIVYPGPGCLAGSSDRHQVVAPRVGGETGPPSAFSH